MISDFGLDFAICSYQVGVIRCYIKCRIKRYALLDCELVCTHEFDYYLVYDEFCGTILLPRSNSWLEIIFTYKSHRNKEALMGL